MTKSIEQLQKELRFWKVFSALVFTGLLICAGAATYMVMREPPINQCNEHWLQQIELICPEALHSFGFGNPNEYAWVNFTMNTGEDSEENS